MAHVVDAIDMLIVAAKDFAQEAFAVNARPEFHLRRARFEYAEGAVRRVWMQRHRRLVAGAWVRNAPLETQEGEPPQEIVEILATTPEGEIVVEQAPVARILAMPPVLGVFTRVVQRAF